MHGTSDSGGAVAAPDSAASAMVRNPGMILAAILPASFMQLIDVSIVNVAVVSIQHALGANSAEVQLVIAAYPLMLASVLVTGARLGDVFGYRRMLLLGIASFTLASVGCAAAPNAPALIGFRLIQGAAAGLMYPQVLTIIQSTFAPEVRARAFGFQSATVSVALIVGPLAGGGLIALDPFGLDWRAIFYVNVPVGLATFVAVWLTLPVARAPRPVKLDLFGSGLIVITLMAFTLPLSEGRELHWPAWSIVLLVASAALLGGFLWFERRLGQSGGAPVVRIALLRHRRFLFGTLARMSFFLGLPAFSLILTLFLQEGRGYTALEAGLTTLWTASGEVVGSLVAHRASKRFGHGVMIAGVSLTLIGVVTTMSVAGMLRTSFAPLATGLVVLGFGIGLFLPSITTFVLSEIPRPDMASASGLMSTAQQVGNTVGLAAVSVVFFSLLAAGASRAATSAGHQLRPELTRIGVSTTETRHDLRLLSPCAASLTAQACPTPGLSRPEGRAVRDAARVAHTDNFTRSFRISLFYELVTYSAALTLVLVARPNHRRLVR